MKNSSKISQLNKSLAFNRALLNLASQSECQTVLVPYLQNKLHNQWLDPRECKSHKDFERKYTFAFAMAQVSQELMDLLSVESLNTQIKDTLEQIEREKLIGEGGYALEGDSSAKK